MPHSHVPEPDVNDGDYDEVGPWDLPPEDWKALRELLSSAFSHDEWRRILTELGYPSAEFPIDAKGAEDFWYHVRKRTEEGAVRWGWRKIVRHLGTASRVQYHPDIRRLVTEHGLGTSPTPDAQPHERADALPRTGDRHRHHPATDLDRSRNQRRTGDRRAVRRSGGVRPRRSPAARRRLR